LNIFGGWGFQLAKKMEGERVGGVSCAFAGRVGVIVETHLVSWTVLKLWQGHTALLESFLEITALSRPLSWLLPE
jgi:hypothetical protein